MIRLRHTFRSQMAMAGGAPLPPPKRSRDLGRAEQGRSTTAAAALQRPGKALREAQKRAAEQARLPDRSSITIMKTMGHADIKTTNYVSLGKSATYGPTNSASWNQNLGSQNPRAAPDVEGRTNRAVRPIFSF